MKQLTSVLLIVAVLGITVSIGGCSSSETKASASVSVSRVN
jgi:hypothetical protein